MTRSLQSPGRNGDGNANGTGIVRSYARTRLGQLHYAKAGDEALAPLILLPQAGRTWTMFGGLAMELSDSYCVYAVDYPGSGASDPLEPGTRIEDIAESVVDVLDGLGIERAHVYGLHGGNKVGAALVAGWPQRILKFVFAGQSHSIVPSNDQRLATTAKTRRKLLRHADEREMALVQWADLFSFISANWWNETLMRKIADASARAAVLAKVVDELQASPSIREFYLSARSYDLERDLGRLAVPTLILEIATPQEDRSVGRQGPELLARIPGSTLVTVEEEDFHGITLEDKPAQLATILRAFLG